MSDIAHVAVHASQFPEAVRRDLLASLRSRQVNHKFHYDSVKQTHQWLALHQAHSPSRHDRDCARIYDRSFAAATAEIKSRRVQLIGLGCGGGQKDVRLIKKLRAGGRQVSYAPCDVSTAMVLVARQAVRGSGLTEDCHPFVCDLATAGNLENYFSQHTTTKTRRLLTFFGMIPNFEPELIVPKLAALVRPKDLLLFSANQAPGRDYVRGMKKILPQYDNTMTREWLMTFLFDLGVERADGALRFTIEARPPLQRVEANFIFLRAREVQVESERIKFRAGEKIRLFFSYRYTPQLVRTTLAHHGLEVLGQWVTASGEEGVFLCRRGTVRKGLFKTPATCPARP